VGSWALLVTGGQGRQESVPPEGLGGGVGVEHPLLEEREAGTAVHLALEQFAFCDLPFGLALIPREPEPGEYRRPVLLQLGDEGVELRQARAGSRSDPVVKPLLRMRVWALSQQVGESLQQLHCLLDLRLQDLHLLDRLPFVRRSSAVRPRCAPPGAAAPLPPPAAG
jgi:hypothetical protein